LQVEDSEAAKADAARLLVRLEDVQRMVLSTAQLHRLFFHYLVQHARAHSAGQPPGGDAEGDVHMEDRAALYTFLQLHFAEDQLAKGLEVRA
jgi:hypothetical protein